MKEKIRAYTNWDDNTHTHYYCDFEVVDKLPKVGDIITDYGVQQEIVTAVNEISLDYEQRNDDVWNYDYYEIKTQWYFDGQEDGEGSYNYAVEKEEV